MAQLTIQLLNHFRKSGYDFLWAVIQEEFDARTFDNSSDRDQYWQLVVIVFTE